MSTLIHTYVGLASAGNLPRAIARMPSGWLALGDPQVLPGYCVLYPDPVVPHLNALTGPARLQFLEDMARTGDVLMEILSPARINYEILGNLEPALHGHIVPRYDSESEHQRTRPVFFYDFDAAPKFNWESHGELIQQIRAGLEA